MSEPTPAHRADTRARAEAALRQYPDLAPEQVAELVHWFRREASALDIGLIASDETLANPYRAFRTRHIDPLRPKDWLWGTVAFTGVAALLMAMLWRAF
jgi:hypothetical protein